MLQGIPLTPVRIEFLPSFRSRLIKQYYDHKRVLSEANIVALSKANPNAKGTKCRSGRRRGIEEAVTAEAGRAPLTEVEVCAVSVGSPTVKSCGETDASGEYELHSLPTGSYKVGFRGRGKSAEFEPEYYLDKPSSGQATSVAVVEATTTSNIDAALAKGPRSKARSMPLKPERRSAALRSASSPWPQRNRNAAPIPTRAGAMRSKGSQRLLPGRLLAGTE
jgi:hypothetical protein